MVRELDPTCCEATKPTTRESVCLNKRSHVLLLRPKANISNIYIFFFFEVDPTCSHKGNQVNHYLSKMQELTIQLNNIHIHIYIYKQVVLVVKNLLVNAGDARVTGLIPRSGRSPGEGNGNPLQYSCLENFMERGAWQATAQGVTKSQTQLSN